MRSTRKSAILVAALGLLAVAPVAAEADPPGPMRWGVFTTAPGAVASGHNYAVYGCAADRMTSPGFTFVMKMISDGGGRDWGSTTVILKPGTYPVTIYCINGTSATGTFVIPDVPPAPQPPLKKNPLPR